MAKHGTILKKGETESRSTTTVGDKVTLHHVTEHSKDKPVVMDWTFDFTDISRVKLMELASRSLVIDCRNSWKKLKEVEAFKPDQTAQTFSVKELLNKQKRGKTVTEKVAGLVKGMSEAELSALIASVTKQA